MLSIILLKKIAELFIMILAGFLLVKLKALKSSDSKVLSRVVLYIMMPCALISAFQVESTPETRTAVLFTFIVGAALNALLVIGARLLRRPLRLNPAEELSLGYTNCLNLLIPMVTALFGSDHILYVNGFSTVQTVFLFTHALFVMKGGGFSLKALFSEVNVIATAVGLLLFVTKIPIPPILGSAIGELGDMIGPTSMLVIGMLIGGMDLRSVIGSGRSYLIVALRLLVFPALILALLKVSGAAGLIENGKEILLICFLAACSPSACIITQMAQVYGGDSLTAGRINVISTLLCAATMPLMVLLYQLWI